VSERHLLKPLGLFLSEEQIPQVVVRAEKRKEPMERLEGVSLGAHRKGTWSIHVTRNWRITFSIDPVEPEIFDLHYEDYH
jgi:plasmid maintenance system killer protein